MKAKGLFHLSVAAVAVAGFAAPVAAQDTGDQRESAEPPVIIVTAQRREENLQDVPIAATAIAGSQLKEKAVENLADLQNIAPSVSITDQGLTQSVNLRGIGIASGSPAVANGVATYIDGVFQPPILTASSFYDIASIEVLRGPQGTLVGSNSTGGAIFINTQSPSTDRVKGYAELGYGSYNLRTAEGAVNLPLSDTLAVRVAGITRWRDSYYDDLGPYNNDPDSLDEQAGRVGVLWQPGSFRALAKAEWVDKNTGGYAYRPIEGTAFDADRQPDFRDLTYNSPTLNHERAFNSSLELRYELDSGIVLRSVTGYTNKRINNLYDSDGSTLALQTSDQFVREREATQEFNIISPTDGKFNWILGGYYQKNKIDVIIQSRANDPIGDPTDIVNFNDKLTLGVFAQLGYKILPNLELQVGGRYSHYKVTSTGSVTIGADGPVFGPDGLVVADLAGSHKDGRATGKVALNWNVDEDNLIYVFAARGYKPGGANSATSEFGPETVMDYEFGWKGNLFGDHLRTQFGGFYMDYKDFQFDAIDAGTGQSGVVNISNAKIKGAEFQAQAKFGGLSFDGGVAYVDSKLDPVTIINSRALPQIGQLGPQCGVGVPSNPPACFDYGPFTDTAGGGPNLFSPKWSYNFGVQYEAILSDDLTLTPRVNYAYVGPRWTNLFYDPALDYLKGRGLVSAQVTLAYRDLKLELYGTNLANKAYVSGQSGNNEFYGAPREFGVRISTRF
ncbi:MAG: TonB-dependent receptor [Candidatus Andeanibacterium colombiense]|uniref:TonB-dependent receptor n=1 Tax=Candidatus Andeanibacterium colombiense TaxID=3121345 RepID=A0AAJ5X912_9SPHN|nr:MAG: TonB-dependent receptor [Sphingomonadaceae bacterium]